jgi:hypothetical protein
MNNVWEERKTDDGLIYWFNKLTEQISWVKVEEETTEHPEW